MTPIRVWSYPSTSSASTYKTTMDERGLLACTCRGWTFKRPGKPRSCRHIEDVVRQLAAATEIRGDGFLFVVPPTTPLTSDAEPIIIDDMATKATMATTVTPVFDAMKASAMTEGKFGYLLDVNGFIVPTKFDKAFANGQWVMDEKIDGHRCQILKRGDDITTTLESVTLPQHIIDQLSVVPFDFHLDGELCIPGGVSTDVPNLKLRSQLTYLAFDLLDTCGQSTLHLPLTERRALLEVVASLLNDATHVFVVAQYDVSWAQVQAIWAKDNGEGVVIKRRDSVYKPGYRSPDWIKVKQLRQLTVTVTGFESGSLGPTAVVLFDLPNGGTGRCKNQDLKATAANPSAYVGRQLVIQCQALTRNGSPRHPMFDHWAGDAE